MDQRANTPSHLDDRHLGRLDALEDELGDAVALVDLEVVVAEVEQQHAEQAPVVAVDDAGTDIDAVLDSWMYKGGRDGRWEGSVGDEHWRGEARRLRTQTAAGRDAAIAAIGDGELEARRDNLAGALGNDDVLRGVQVVAGRRGAATRGRACRGRVETHEELRGGHHGW